VVAVLAVSELDGGTAGNTDVDTCSGAVVIARAWAAGAAVAILVTDTGFHVGSARDGNVDTAAGFRVAVARTFVGGSSGVVEQIRNWEARDLRSREDGRWGQSQDEAHEAGEVDSGGDHCCGCVGWLV
jgi:hypothetical protein